MCEPLELSLAEPLLAEAVAHEGAKVTAKQARRELDLAIGEASIYQIFGSKLDGKGGGAPPSSSGGHSQGGSPDGRGGPGAAHEINRIVPLWVPPPPATTKKVDMVRF